VKTAFDAQVEERLVRYARIDSQSDENTGTVPSTATQMDMLREIERELKEMGASDVRLTDTGFVFATVPSTTPASESKSEVPTVAFLAHVDTAPQYFAAGVKPIVHRAWDGSPIVLPDNPDIVISTQNSPYIAGKIGDDIITASGQTLLGADDKAGCAIVVTLAEHLLAHPEIPHGKIRLCFTTDEEIGTGVHHLDLNELGADVAYTLDGSELGEVTYETFSADKAVVHIEGVSIHPGSATGIMVNALTLAAKILMLLPSATRTPDTTSGKRGFIHAYALNGRDAEATLSFILRDFEREGLQSHGELLQTACAAVQATEPRAKITCTITKQYRNMRYWLENDMRPVEMIMKAMQVAGVTPKSNPIRGGTDGSQLTERGLPTPNIFCGSMNVHGPYEYVSVQDMGKAVEVCVELAELWAEA
jgi:tripeptide aminopeptidase